jgi:hypothetical protein
MPPRMACIAMRQSFAERGVTPAHRHRAYKCAALRAASRPSGAMIIGNSPSTRLQRENRSGVSAPCRTSCRIGGASHTDSPCSRAMLRSRTSGRSWPRKYAIHTEESTSISRYRGGAGSLRIVTLGNASRAAKRENARVVTAAHEVLERDMHSVTSRCDVGDSFHALDQLRVENYIRAAGTCPTANLLHGDLNTHLMCIKSVHPNSDGGNRSQMARSKIYSAARRVVRPRRKRKPPSSGNSAACLSMPHIACETPR